MAVTESAATRSVAQRSLRAGLGIGANAAKPRISFAFILALWRLWGRRARCRRPSFPRLVGLASGG